MSRRAGQRWRRWAGGAALAAVAVAGCGDAGQPAAGPTVRLVERLGEAEVVAGPTGAPAGADDAVRAPAAAASGTAAAVRLSRLLRPRDRQYLGRVALEHPTGGIDERLAIVVPGGTSLRFPLPGSGPRRLRLALGAVPGAEGADAGPLRASVRLLHDGGTETVVERAVGARWTELAVAVDLPPGAALELAADGPPSRRVAWGAPELVGGRAPGWDVVLISLDTLRADHLGCYGYRRPTSPHLDAFAADAFRFAAAFAPAPWTLPSHHSLFNGLYPLSHGDRRSPPLATMLWRAGYRTEARAGGGVMDYRMGSLAQGFDSYRHHDWVRDLDDLGATLAATDDRRRFLFLHTYEPHDPYIDTRFAAALPAGRIEGYFDKGLYPAIRDSITGDERRYIEALYDGDIAYTDERLGELFARLDASGALERSIVAIVSDHGEQFWEHGSWRHGQNLYDEQIHVPFILRLPAGLRRELGLPAAGVIEDQVRLIDLYPTLLELLGLPLERPVQGRSLLPLLRGEEPPPAAALAEYLNLTDTQSRAIRFRGFKLLRTRRERPGTAAEERELYDLRRDPAELVNLIEQRPEIAGELLALLDRLAGGDWDGEARALETEDLDPDLRRDLEALGYIGN